MTFAVVLVLIRLVWMPLQAWKAETVEAVELLQQKVAEKRALSKNKTRVKERLEKATASLAETSKFFEQGFGDTRELQLGLQKRIERLAAAAGVEVLSTDWPHPLEEDMLLRAPIKLRCRAAPERLLRLLAAVENAERFLAIDSLRVYARHESSTLQADLRVSAYGLKTRPEES